jgi:hypothetical protein
MWICGSAEPNKYFRLRYPDFILRACVILPPMYRYPGGECYKFWPCWQSHVLFSASNVLTLSDNTGLITRQVDQNTSWFQACFNRVVSKPDLFDPDQNLLP